MRKDSCHGPSRVVTRDLPEPPRPVAPEWGGNTRTDPLDGLSGEARRRVHENNLRIREGDAERYEAYVKEYLRGARLCRTAAELRAYGKHAWPDRDDEPGSTIDERIAFYKGPWRTMEDTWYAATKEVSGIRLRLQGKPVPLDVSVDVSATA